MSHPGEIMALGCALCWSIAVLLWRKVGTHDPRALNLFKNTVASAMLCLTLLAMGRGFDTTRSTEDWLRLFASAVLGLTVGDTLFFMGLQRIGASVAAVTDCAYSPVVVILSVLLLHETPKVALLWGAPLVVAGLLVVSWQPRGVVPGRLHVDRKGVLLAVAGVVATALGVVVAKPALGRSDLIEATTVRLLFGTVSLVAWQASTGDFRSALGMFRPQRLWVWMLPATVAGTYVSMVLWLGGIKYTEASTAALLNQMATVFLLILARLFGGEVVPPRRWLGAGLALAGAVAILAG
jgi:drug/metabolite transporter (DMT)-like permease